MPILRELHEEMKDENVKIIGINLAFNDKMEDAVALLEENGINFPILLDDGTAATAYGIRSIPTTVIVGKDGIVQENVIGLMDHDKLTEIINPLK
jgi:peroxiredoxin